MNVAGSARSRIALGGAAAAAVAVVFLLPAGHSAADEQRIDTGLGYQCRFPSGTQTVTARVRGTLPGSGSVGAPIGSAGLSLDLAVPRAALTGSSWAGATAVDATATLSTPVSENGAAQRPAGTALHASAVPVPASGDLTLAAQGTWGPVTPSAGGLFTIDAGPLALTLTPRLPDGSPTGPAPVSATCTPAPEAGTVIADIAVREPTAVPQGGATGGAARLPRENGATAPSPSPEPSQSFCPTPAPDPSLLDPTAIGTAPPGSIFVNQQFPGCAYAGGYSNVSKLGAATGISTDLLNLTAGARTWVNFKAGLFETDSVGEIAISPSRSTLLGFGFMPTSATLRLSVLKPVTIATISQISGNTAYTAKVSTEVSLRLSDVSINGTALEVGPDCRTATPIKLVVSAAGDKTHNAYTVDKGGDLSGTIDIPRFTGCGVGENLDNLFTAAISGPGNYVRLTQGALCTPLPQPVNCPAVPPALKP